MSNKQNMDLNNNFKNEEAKNTYDLPIKNKSIGTTIVKYNPFASGNSTDKYTNVKRVRLTTSLLHFASFYELKNSWYRIFIIIVCALIQGFLSILLIQNTGLYNFGISSVTQGLARITYVQLSLTGAKIDINLIYQLVFWLLYLFINIPLIFFSWFKIGRRFTLYTTIYLVITNLFGFALGQIPGIEDLSLFTNVNNNAVHNLLLQAYKDNPNPVVINLFNDKAFLNSLSFVPGLWEVNADVGRNVGLLCYGLLFALTSSFFYTIIFISGGSSGGSDFITQWYATKKYKSIATIIVYVNLITLLLGVLLGSYIPGSMILERFKDSGIGTGSYDTLLSGEVKPITLDELAWSVPIFFSPNIVGTLISLVLFSQIMNSLFPKYRLARVEIYTDKTMEIRNLMLNDDGHQHSLSIEDIRGGYSLDKRQVIVTISMYIDVPRLIRKIRAIDDKCLVSITSIRGIDGYIYLSEPDKKKI
ncbi:DUF2179 domain-containing protein [Mycoplasmoides alvi]|uniref:DUF2179 domain-containing protein n=1 Tax=Mycoplasmoides alvi TaxID=78580 RepID=UPI00069631D1|nr:DUF2179 domain-containing protein [Mycoplasmoides alvi]